MAARERFWMSRMWEFCINSLPPFPLSEIQGEGLFPNLQRSLARIAQAVRFEALTNRDRKPSRT